MNNDFDDVDKIPLKLCFKIRLLNEMNKEQVIY